MDLQYLNGFDGDDFGELGQLFGKKKAKVKAAKKISVPKKKTSLLSKLKAKKAAKQQPTNNGQPKPKKKGFFKKVLNTVNRINPATVLLRNGVLAAMKLNVKNVAARLRWSYLTPEQAAQKGIDPQKFQRLVATRQKLENIFYGAGGNPKNLKKAMLGGKGNSDKAVAGLDGFSLAGVEYMNVYTPMPQLLGPEIYYSENVEGFEGLGQLGEPVTLASVGAAMGVISGIVAALKQIGDIFKNKTEGSKDFDENVNEAAENNQPIPGTTPVPVTNETAQQPILTDKTSVEESFKPDTSTNTQVVKTESSNYSTATNPIVPIEEQENNVIQEKENTSLPVVTNQLPVTETNNPPAPTKETFWEKNKSWLKPVAIGVGGLSLIAIGFAVMKPKNTQSRSSPGHGLSGVPKKRKNHKRQKHKSPSKSHPSKKTAVALL